MINNIIRLIGCSAATAALVLNALDVASAVALLMSLTGIGAAAAAAVIAYRVAIKKIAWEAGKAAAIQM